MTTAGKDRETQEPHTLSLRMQNGAATRENGTEKP